MFVWLQMLAAHQTWDSSFTLNVPWLWIVSVAVEKASILEASFYSSLATEVAFQLKHVKLPLSC